MSEHHDKSHQSTMRGKHEGSDGNHIPPHGPKGAGSKDSKANPKWQVVNRAKQKWASLATDRYQLYELGSVDDQPDVHNRAIQKRNCV